MQNFEAGKRKLALAHSEVKLPFKQHLCPVARLIDFKSEIKRKCPPLQFLIHCEFNTISSKACKTSVLKTTPWMQPFGPMLSLLPGKASSWVAIRNLPGNAKAGLVCSLPGSSKSRENAHEPLLHTPEAPPIAISPH